MSSDSGGPRPPEKKAGSDLHIDPRAAECLLFHASSSLHLSTVRLGPGVADRERSRAFTALNRESMMVNSSRAVDARSPDYNVDRKVDSRVRLITKNIAALVVPTLAGWTLSMATRADFERGPRGPTRTARGSVSAESAQTACVATR
jgi:hypothetical protein